MPDCGWCGPPCRITPVAVSFADDEFSGDVPANEVFWADHSIVTLAGHGRR